MRRGILIARLAATTWVSIGKLGPAHPRLSALDRCKRTLRALAVIALGLASFAHEAATQESLHRIAIITDYQRSGTEQLYRNALHARGYDEGRNFQIEFRYIKGQYDRIPGLVDELVALHPDIIGVAGSDYAVAVHAAAPTIPLVFLAVADPVALGLVPNLAHPGGNVTGITTMVPEGFSAKIMELLKTAAPTASRIAILVNPKNQLYKPDPIADAARRLGLELVTVRASKVEELEGALQEAHAKGADAINVLGDPVTARGSVKIANLALQYRWPSIYLFRQNVLDGGLMSYGPNSDELVGVWARQIDAILKGAKPGELPVEQPTRFDLIINLKTAETLGITIPAALLVQAAEVIK